MTQVTQERMKGNYAAAHVAKLLSLHCLVRPVASDTDVGIDLYCETVDNDERQPFLHFWVQVKSGPKQVGLLKNGNASCAFESRHLKYWQRQPVPVFAALVPLSDWPIGAEPIVYIVDVMHHLLWGDPDLTQATNTLQSRHQWPSNGTGVKQFIDEEVPAATARLQIQRGVIDFQPSLTPRYFKAVANVPIKKHIEIIETQLRRTAAFAPILLEADATRGALEQYAGFCRTMARIAAQFVDDKHWETYAAQAISSHIDKNYEDAARLYGDAIKSIDDDSNALCEGGLQATRGALKRWQDLASRKEPMPR